MTLDQLRIFVAVAERQHMTRAAEVLNISQSAISSAIATLEARHDIKLFDRVGRGIALTEPGKALLIEARAVIEKVADTDLMLAEYGGLRRGTLRIAASQTVGGYWLPALLLRFRTLHPELSVALEIGNSETVAGWILSGETELGFVEGEIDHPALARWPVAQDRMMLVHRDPGPPIVDPHWIRTTPWILREPGSGTRSTFEAALATLGMTLAELTIALVLPSNEAVRTAAEAGAGAAVLSALVVSGSLAAGTLHALPFGMRPRSFLGLRHKERYQSKAAQAFADMVRRA